MHGALKLAVSRVAVTEFNSLYVRIAMKLALPDDIILPCMQHRLHCSNVDKDFSSCRTAVVSLRRLSPLYCMSPTVLAIFLTAWTRNA